MYNLDRQDQNSSMGILQYRHILIDSLNTSDAVFHRLDLIGAANDARQLRSRIASLRAQMVKQRREIDALTKDRTAVDVPMKL